MWNCVRGLGAVALLAAVAACNTLDSEGAVPVTRAAPPAASPLHARITHALACMRASGALRGVRIAVTIQADGTGKYNNVGHGATGNFLPQGPVAVYASQAVLLAGAHPYNYYELNTEQAMRAFANLDTYQRMSDDQDEVLPQYVLSTAFSALDFIDGPTADLRIGGFGPTMTGLGAALEATAELYEPGSRAIEQVSAVKRYVAFREVDAGAARLVGDGSGTLITGEIAYADQQRLQEASREAMALSVADVLSRFPRVPKRCRAELADLLSGKAWQESWAEPEPPPAKPAARPLKAARKSQP